MPVTRLPCSLAWLVVAAMLSIKDWGIPFRHGYLIPTVSTCVPNS